MVHDNTAIATDYEALTVADVVCIAEYPDFYIDPLEG